MRALTYLGPWEMSVTQRADPVIGPDDVLISVIATGICGSDVHGYTGHTGRRHSGQVMGHETVGRIARAGSGVTDLTAGQVVAVNPLTSCGQCDACLAGERQVCATAKILGVEPTLDGSFAEYLVARADSVVPISGRIPEEHGALVEPLAVGYHAVRRGSVLPDDRLLIIGGGPIGQACAIAASRVGTTRVLVSEPSEVRRGLLAGLGFATTEPARLRTDIHRVLGGPASVAIDAVGIAASMADALTGTAAQGRVVLVGMGENAMALRPYEVSVTERSIIGSYCYSDAHFTETAAWVSGGHSELDGLIGELRPLADGPDAFREIASGNAATNKILLRSDAHR